MAVIERAGFVRLFRISLVFVRFTDTGEPVAVARVRERQAEVPASLFRVLSHDRLL